MHIFAFVLLVFCSSPLAFANAKKYSGKNAYNASSFYYHVLKRQMLEAAQYLETLRAESASGALDLKIREPRTRDSACIARYASLFNKPRIDIRIIFGYEDAAEMALDPIGRAALADQLLSRCSPDYPTLFACGFRAALADPSMFQKEIKDPYGNMRLVQITLVDSALTVRDPYNRTDPKQKEKTERTERAFLGALRTADVVFYEGHSRNGGGPDFAPPVLNRRNRTDYRWYRESRIGRNAMKEALVSGTPPKVIGLFSCDSELHFLRTLREVAPKSIYFLSRGESWYEDTGFTTFAALNGLLGQVCKPAIHQSLKHPSMDRGSWMFLYNF